MSLPQEKVTPHAKPGRSNPFFIVLNVGSGKGDSNVAESTIRSVLEEAGQAHEFVLVDNAEALPEAARRAVEQAKQRNGVVVVAGGDGTINTVAQAALGSGRPFGVLPQGTFNYFGRTHGIPEDADESTRALLDANVRPVQVGMVNERIFLVNASLGLYPKLLEERETRKRRFGRSRLVALWSALLTLLGQHQSLIIELEHEQGSETIRTPILFVGNNALQLKQVGILEASVVEDGLLTAITMKPAGTAAMFALLVRGALGRLGESREVESFAFKRMTVRQRRRHGSRRMKVAMDGEICWLRTPIEFRLAPHPLLLLAPAPSASTARAA
ncbi:MAG: diacylglycerol/lipid kinase family protein [Burkholderiales bacterium]